MGLRIVRLPLLIGAIVGFYLAYEQYNQGQQIVAQGSQVAGALDTLTKQLRRLERAPRRAPLLPHDEAVEAFLSALIDDTDLLGSSVRMTMGEKGIQWQPVRYGVDKAQLTFKSAAELSAGFAFTSLLWQVITSQPASIVGATITVGYKVVEVVVRVEIYALSGGRR